MDLGMQLIVVFSRLAFIALIYIFIYRVFMALLADLREIGIYQTATGEYGRLEILADTETIAKGRFFNIGGKGLTVGRGKHNDIVLPDNFVSADHAVFRFVKGRTVLEDLGSTNGTWVNDERIQDPVQLTEGDYVKIGSITFQYSRGQ